MFASTGLFKAVKCPGGSHCDLGGCIFSHDFPTLAQDEAGLKGKSTDTSSTNSTKSAEEPPVKRRRLEDRDVSIPGRELAGKKTSASSTQAFFGTQVLPKNAVWTPPLKSTKTSSVPPKTLSARTALASSISRTVSPPKIIAKGKLAPENPPPEIPNLRKESLAPRLLRPNPAPYPQRVTFLKLIHEQISRLNKLARQDDASKQSFVLTEAEVISMALDEEEKVGREHGPIYKSIIGHRVVRLKKLKLQEWRDSLVDHFKKKFGVAEKPKPLVPVRLDTGLDSWQEVAVLSHLLTPLAGLEAHGYVTAPPSPEEVQKATETVEAGAGFERCDRCGTRFRVFPGRNSDETSPTFGRLTSTENGCTYHWARAIRPQKVSKVAAEGENYHPCCHGAVGSRGCTETTDHVFQATGISRKASVLQFMSTPDPSDSIVRSGAVTFDCEMGYTTLGMELIRLTACSWPSNKLLLDVLVRPLGEVIDFNTRFSGVTDEQFARAPPWGAHINSSEAGSESGELGPEPEPEGLRLVESPQTARQLLFDLLTPSTPLIGHAIDNDLNTCRVIHPTIVDTVLLFPHPRGLPARFGLRMLASKYLNRSIQAAGAAGHDSMEDASATGDLVRWKVKEKWERMEREGWKFNGDVLVPPKVVEASHAVDGEKGKKRLASAVRG